MESSQIETPRLDEVESKAQQVNEVDPDGIISVRDQLSAAKTSAGDHSAELSSVASDLDGAWEGPDADAFVGYIGNLSQAGSNVNAKLDEAANALTSISEELRGIKEAITGIREQANTEIENNTTAKNAEAASAQALEDASKQDPQGKPLPPGFKNAAMIRQEATQKNEEIAQHAIDDIDRQLHQADAAIHSAMSPLQADIQGGYSAVASPGAGGTVAASAKYVPGLAGSDTGSFGGGGSSNGSGSVSGGSAMMVGSGGGGLGSSGGPPSGGPPPGDVKQWISEAIKILQENGIPVTEADSDKIWAIIEKESGGDPHSINNWDSNAAKGTPSKGLMQCIDPTFNAHKLPGHDDIYNPVDNIIAGVRYTFDRYGGFEGHPGLKAMAGGGGYQGY